MFKLSVINDEIAADFGRAAEVAAQEFGLQFIEIRALWGKNIMQLDAKEIAEARRILEKYKLRVSKISDRKSTRLNSSHLVISYAVFCLKKKKQIENT